MATIEMDYRGLKCPVPTLKLTNIILTKKAATGDILVVTADCPTFEADVRDWVSKMGAVLVRMQKLGEGKGIRVEIRIS